MHVIQKLAGASLAFLGVGAIGLGAKLWLEASK